MCSYSVRLYPCTLPRTRVPPPGPSPLPSPAATSGVDARVTELHNRLEDLLLRCQGLLQRFDERIEHLDKELHSHRKRFLADLDEVEVWLGHAYTLLCQEPTREVGEGYGGQQLETDDKGTFVVQ